mgnify:CR=1 FL=1|tara:strand:+ start:3373 stop:3663 length:291 start_codon:yes stop_codon:yes gene_type:complete
MIFRYSFDDALLKSNKADYQVKKIYELASLNYFLFIVYYVLAVLAVLSITFQYDFNKYLKVFIAIIFFTYPFFIYYVEEMLIKNYNLSLNLLSGSV